MNKSLKKYKIVIIIQIIIVIILGIYYINNKEEEHSYGCVDDATNQAMQMFNARFSSYAGQQTAVAVKSLMTAIQSGNGAETYNKISASNGLLTDRDGIEILAETKALGTYNQISAILNSVYNTKQYNVTFTYGDGTNHPVDCTCEDGRRHQGYIISVRIEEI